MVGRIFCLLYNEVRKESSVNLIRLLYDHIVMIASCLLERNKTCQDRHIWKYQTRDSEQFIEI